MTVIKKFADFLDNVADSIESSTPVKTAKEIKGDVEKVKTAGKRLFGPIKSGYKSFTKTPEDAFKKVNDLFFNDEESKKR